VPAIGRYLSHQGRSAARLRSDIHLLVNIERVIDFDAQMAHRAFLLRVTEEKLHSVLHPCSAVD
jgi:hypothetical protein